MAKQKAVICPYCGHVQHLGDACRACGGRFDADSRKATRAEMGAWFIRDPAKPFRPGCSHETIRRLVERGKITKYTILRGPSTRQFWTVARRVPGVAHLLGYCHACDVPVRPEDRACPKCRAAFDVDADRDRLGIDSDGKSESLEVGFSIADLLRPESLRAPGSTTARRDHEPLSAFFDDELPAEWAESGESPRSPGQSTDAVPDPADGGGDADRIGRVTIDALDHSLRRTVARQRRTIRGLVAIAALLAAVVVGGAMWSLVSDRGDLGEAAPVDVAPSSSDALPDDRSAAPPETDADAPMSGESTTGDVGGDVDGGIDGGLDASLEDTLDNPIDNWSAALDAFDIDAFESIDAARAHLAGLQAQLAQLELELDVESTSAETRARIEALRERLDDAIAALELRSFLEDPM